MYFVIDVWLIFKSFAFRVKPVNFPIVSMERIWIAFLIIFYFSQIALALIDPPIIQTIPIKNNLVERQKFKLGCTLSSGSVPITFEWFKDGKPIVSNTKYVIRNVVEDISDLFINRVTAEDAGVFKCKATNAGGSDSLEVIIRVISKFNIFVLIFDNNSLLFF